MSFPLHPDVLAELPEDEEGTAGLVFHEVYSEVLECGLAGEAAVQVASVAVKAALTAVHSLRR